MVLSAQTIIELQRYRVASYRAAHPDIMQAIRPEFLKFIPLANMSRKYLNELLECEACYRLSEYLEVQGRSREARYVHGLAESSLFALASVDSYRGALQDILLCGRLPSGWKIPQLPRLKILLSTALRTEHICREIYELEGLQIKSGLEALKDRIWFARNRRPGVYAYDNFVPLS